MGYAGINRIPRNFHAIHYPAVVLSAVLAPGNSRHRMRRRASATLAVQRNQVYAYRGKHDLSFLHHQLIARN